MRMKILTAITATLVLMFALFACTAGSDKRQTGRNTEGKTAGDNYNKLITQQPAHTMDYSPTRDTKNFWIDTWGTKGKVSYVYLVSNGKPWAFAVLNRLPVTYCVGLIPPEQFVNTPGASAIGDTLVKAPSIDGTYASASNCGAQYGEDATTGAYVEWTVGADSTILLRDQPLPLNTFADALPLGDTTAEQAIKADD